MFFIQPQLSENDRGLATGMPAAFYLKAVVQLRSGFAGSGPCCHSNFTQS